MNKKEIWVIIACFCGIGICYGLQYSFSIFFVEITNYFQVDRAESSLIFSITLLIYGLYSPVIGILTNKYGGKKIFKIAAIILLFGLILSSFAKSIFQLYFTIGIITAIGMNSVGFVPSVIILTNYFSDKKGLALGLATTGVGAGAIFFSLLSKFLIDIYSWQKAFIIIGIFCAVLIFSISFLLPEPPKNKKFTINLSFLKKKEFWLMQGGMSCGAMTIQGIMLHIVSIFLEKGAKNSLAVLTVSIIAIAGSTGKILWGYLSDFFKPITLYVFSCFLIILSLIILFLAKNPFLNYIVIIFPILFGIGYGSFAPLFPTLAHQLFKEDFGNVIGLLTMANGIGAFFSTYLMGYFYDLNGNYNLAIEFLIFLISMSVILFSLAFIVNKR